MKYNILQAFLEGKKVMCKHWAQGEYLQRMKMTRMKNHKDIEQPAEAAMVYLILMIEESDNWKIVEVRDE